MAQITLDKVRRVLRKTLGWESFTASLITSVEASHACPTACISKDGRMQYHPEFVDKYVEDESDLFSLIVHELMHPLFDHFVHGSGKLENIGADAVINAIISRVFSRQSNRGKLFRRFYQDEGMEGLLRPESDMNQGRYAKLYRLLYMTQDTPRLSTGEVIQSLKVLAPENESPEVALLGSHGNEGDGPGDASESGEAESKDNERTARLAELLLKAAQEQGGQHAGQCDSLLQLLVQAARSGKSLKKDLLQRYATRRKLDKIVEQSQRRSLSVSPIPLHPTKRDLVLMAADIPLFQYHNQLSRPTKDQQGLAVYLDVSGSVLADLPRILGVLHQLRQTLKTIFLFSNKVVEISFTQLMKGELESTYGTDFDCVADSIVENRFDRAVVITDGFASLDEERAEMLRNRRVRLLTILIGMKTNCPDLEPFGDIVGLEEVTN